MGALDIRTVPAQRRASAALDAITTARSSHARAHRRPPALTAREALAALEFEALLIWTAAHNLVNGVDMSDDDLERLTVAGMRIEAIGREFHS